MPVDFSSLLADTLSNRGYEVEDASPIEGASGASYPVSMVAHRKDETFLVDALASRKVRDEDVQAVASIVDDAGLTGAIVLALKGDEHASSAPGADRVEVWDRQRVEQAVGALVVDRHLAANGEVDDIGPSPVDPYETAEEPAPSTGEREAATAERERGGGSPSKNGEHAPTPANAASGPRPAQDTGTTEADPTPEPAGEPGEAEPASEPEPEPATAAEKEPTPDLDDDVDHRDFVDPEDMLERAEQLMQQGGIDDGDAEIIVEDDDPDPEPAEQPAQPEPQPEAEPSPAPSRSRPDPDPEAQPADDGSDAEILEPEPEPERPGPEGEAPEPETATTARDTGTDRREAEPDRPEPSGQATASPAAAAGPAHDEEAFVSGATIEPAVDETEARLTAEEALFEADEARLELLPFRVYRYRAQLEGDGHSREDEGRVWVSTQSGAVVRAPRGDRVDEPEVPHERFQDSLPRAKTQEAAREHLLDTLERREELRQDYSESAVIERVRLEPDPETLDVDLLGKAFAPRWRVEGSNGTVFVDAVTGELVNE